jgi:transcriptional regulator with XRE-family HTH domain
MPIHQTDEKLSFAKRLNEVCDDKKMPVHGRQTELARLFSVGPKAARKWLIGEGFPEMELAIKIAKWAGVSFNWLMTGHGPKREGHADTKVVVLGEVLESMPGDDGQQVLDFIEYKIQRSESLFVGERLARYMTMIDAFKKDRINKK